MNGGDRRRLFRWVGVRPTVDVPSVVRAAGWLLVGIGVLLLGIRLPDQLAHTDAVGTCRNERTAAISAAQAALIVDIGTIAKALILLEQVDRPALGHQIDTDTRELGAAIAARNEFDAHPTGDCAATRGDAP